LFVTEHFKLAVRFIDDILYNADKINMQVLKYFLTQLFIAPNTSIIQV